MKQSLRQLGLGVLFFVMSTAAHAADKVYVEASPGSGVSQDQAQTVEELVSTAVPNVGSYEVVKTPEDIDFILRPKLLRLGSAYILKIDKVDKDSTIVFSGQLKAARIEELDSIVERLTRAVINETPVEKSATVDNVTETETTQGTNRKPVIAGTFIGIGPIAFSNLGTSGVGFGFETGLSWDVNAAIIQLSTHQAYREGGFFIDGTVGGKLFLTKTGIAPYVSADFGYGVTKTRSDDLFDGEAEGGFVLGGGAGIHFLRTSAINLALGVRVGLLLSTNSMGNPAVYSLLLGIYF